MHSGKLFVHREIESLDKDDFLHITRAPTFRCSMLCNSKHDSYECASRPLRISSWDAFSVSRASSSHLWKWHLFSYNFRRLILPLLQALGALPRNSANSSRLKRCRVYGLVIVSAPSFTINSIDQIVKQEAMRLKNICRRYT